MTALDWLLIITGLLAVVPCTYLYYKEKGKGYRNLMLLSLVAGPLWAASVVIFRNSTELDKVLLLGRIIYVISIFIGLFFFRFQQYFPKKKTHGILINTIVYGIAVFLLYSIIFTELFIKSPILEGYNSLELGRVYYVWMVWMLGIFVFGLINILKDYQNLGKIERIQLKYFIFAIIIPIAGVVPTNAILPLFGNYNFIWVGPLAMSMMSVLLFFGIMNRYGTNKYNLPITLFKGASLTGYVCIVTLLGSTLSESIQTTNDILGKFVWTFLFLIITVGLYVGGRYLLNHLIAFWFRNVLPNYTVIRDTYLNSTAEILQSEKLALATMKQINKAVSLEWSTIVLNPKSQKPKVLSTQRFSKLDGVKEFLTITSDAQRILSELENICNHDMLEYILNNDYEKYSTKLLERMELMSNFMENLNASEIFVIGDGDALLFISYKKGSASSITSIERELLRALLKSFSLGLMRAELHKQVELANVSLQERVDLQTHELQIKIAELQEARRKEADMIDIMGHELRTPATIVKLNAQLLEQIIERRDLDGLMKYVGRIKEGVEREIKLINTLLSSAKLEGDKIELTPEEVDIDKEIEMSLHAHEKQAEEKGLVLINKANENTPTVYGDHARIVEIINNLISNAVKYTDKGSITVETKDLERFVQVNVIDTGNGISEKDIPMLGKKFYRVQTYIESDSNPDNLNIVRPGGTGLGLYVVFNLVRKMGGEIHVKSKLGEGSTFMFTLPKYTGQETSRPGGKTNDMFEKLGLRDIQD